MKVITLVILLGLFSSISYAAENAEKSTIRVITTRESGSHSIFLNRSIPSQGCTLEDRAVIVENGSVGSKTLISSALAALVNRRDVIVRVDGCTMADPKEDTTVTSPKIIRIAIY